MKPLVLALPKGRILDETVALFARAGLTLPSFDNSRKLIFDGPRFRVLVLRSSDIATYVGHGAADVGVVGSDVLAEEPYALYQPLDLQIGQCRMVMAEKHDAPFDESGATVLRVATKYPKTTAQYLGARGVTFELIKLSGAIELGPLVGLCHRVVDITQSGETLKQNGLVEVATIASVSSRLVVNPAAQRLRRSEILES